MSAMEEGELLCCEGFFGLPTNIVAISFVEFESANDLKAAVEKLDGREFKGSRVTCTADV